MTNVDPTDITQTTPPPYVVTPDDHARWTLAGLIARALWEWGERRGSADGHEAFRWQRRAPASSPSRPHSSERVAAERSSFDLRHHGCESCPGEGNGTTRRRPWGLTGEGDLAEATRPIEVQLSEQCQAKRGHLTGHDRRERAQPFGNAGRKR